MILIAPEQAKALPDWFLPDRPGPLVGLHVLHTGHGAIFADRWSHPRALLAQTADNYTLVGDPAALSPADLKGCVKGYVDAPEQFLPLLRETFSNVLVWDRVMYELVTPSPTPLPDTVRCLETADVYQIWALTPESAWIAKTWGGPAGLAAGGRAWGAFVNGRLVSIACSFYVGERYEDIGVVTEPGYRGQGLSVACAQGLCLDIIARGRRASWTTTSDNRASVRVAEKLGFSLNRQDVLYIVDISPPASAHRSED